MIFFSHPIFLVLVPLLGAVVWFRARQRRSSVQFSTLKTFQSIHFPTRAAWMSILPIVRFVVFCLIVLALARPQGVTEEQELKTQGIDIILSVDISGSMMAEDFKPLNRLAVALDKAKKFVAARKHDRIGLVVFASQAYTQCPLTLDHDVLIRLMSEVQIGLIKDGTAVGLAIANAINRLRDSSAKSKVIVLLTDGENNAGNIDPITAAELAKGFGIKIHTIGVGRGGLVPFPVDDPLFGRRYVQARVDIDEASLKQIAALTGGLYFRAYDEASLEQIYEQIDQLERSEIEVKQYSHFEELFPWVLYPALILLLFEVSLERSVLLKIP